VVALPPVLLVMAGLPGAGKSTVGLALSRDAGWVYLDKDTVKTALLESGIREAEAGRAAYEVSYGLCRDLLVVQGLSVVFDSPALYARIIQRTEAIASEGRGRKAVVLCLASGRVRHARIAARVNRASQQGVALPGEGDGSELYAHLPAGTIRIDGTRPVEANVATIMQALTERSG
jgi:predicted kinase